MKLIKYSFVFVLTVVCCCASAFALTVDGHNPPSDVHFNNASLYDGAVKIGDFSVVSKCLFPVFDRTKKEGNL